MVRPTLTRRLKRTGAVLLAVMLLAAAGLALWEPFLAEQPGPPPPPRPYQAEVIRDAWGVPHIHGATDPDVAFGIAWAHAEDDFSTLQDVLAMARGRYGAIAGQEGAAVDYAYHLLDARGRARRFYPALPADVRALLEAYASGLNRYAARHPDEVKLRRLFPVNGQDIAAGFAVRLPFFAGIDRTLARLVEGSPLDPEFGPSLNGKPLPSAEEGGGDIPAEFAKPPPIPIARESAFNGSNAFAVAPRRSGDGATRLVSNTHQPWRGAAAWYELVIESDAGWHFAGATFPGSPYPFLGHNETLGWTNTINRPDLADVYRLVMNADGSRYRLDGRWLPLRRKRVWLPVRFGPLVLPVPHTVAMAEHGPVVENGHGAFALRYAGIDTLAALETYYRLTRARDFQEWQAALSARTIPSTNFIYADKTGTIAYVYNARFPLRKPGVDWRHVLPGDRADLIWRETAPWQAVPRIVNPPSGFLFNANNTPFVAAGPGSEIDPATVSPLLGVELDMTNRARRAVKLLAATPRIGRRELEAIKYDTGYERAGFALTIVSGIAALDVKDDPLLARAQALLAQWDWTLDGKGPADTLATMVLNPAMHDIYNHHRPAGPRAALEGAARHLQRWFGRLDVPLGQAQRLRQGGVDLPMLGGGTLRGALLWDIDPQDGRLVVKHGDSFLMFAEWPADGPVRSQSVVPFGAATTRPDSLHYADQAALFAAQKLKPVHFERADVIRNAVRRTIVSNRQP